MGQNSVVMTQEDMDNWRQRELIKDLAFLFRDYKEECWADSTLDEYSRHEIIGTYLRDHEQCLKFPTRSKADSCYKAHGDKLFVRACEGYGPCRIPKYQHREPTFIGFIKWIEKKTR